jgi:predicted RND superfamily exporter protein
MSPMHSRRTAWGPIFLTAAATSALLSLGLCGTGFVLSASSAHPMGILFKLGVVCLGLMVIFGVMGIVGLVVDASNSRRP